MSAELLSSSLVIAVDGTAASGKGTLARRLADHLGYAYLDTGLLYRAVALSVLNSSKPSEIDEIDEIDEELAVQAAESLDPATFDDDALRAEDVTRVASRIAALPGVRTSLLQMQQRFAAHPPGGVAGAILDGRDIGTVICPGAQVKIFVDADVETRAARRVKELQERGVEAIPARVLQEMRERDERDRSRSVAPLVPAEDAYMLDTTEMDADAAFAAALNYIESRNMSQA
jgi:CMP/dCMP kinase